MTLAVTANLERKADAAARWSARVLADTGSVPDVVFLQEVPQGDWMGMWSDAGFTVWRDVHPRWMIRSAVITNLTVDQEAPELATADYHGSYVHSVVADLGDGEGPVRLVSFHASPNPAESPYTADWPSGVTRPKPRERHPGQQGAIYDSDYVLATLAHHSRGGERILAAGDLNESRRWDDVHGETWWPGVLTACEAGHLELPLNSLFAEEPPTRFAGEHPYQLDHVITSRDLAPRITRAHIDPGWTSVEQVRRDGLSDHAPVWFTIDPPGTPSAARGGMNP